MFRIFFIIVIILAVGGIFFIFNQEGMQPVEFTDDTAIINETVELQTNYGAITVEFFRNDAPKTVENFLRLTKDGFYSGLTFHRVIDGFMIQGGDPSGDGTGGPGYTFEDEIDPQSPLYRTGYVSGIVAMANSGPNTNGSQFFIMLKDTTLPPNYTIFGKVTKGLNVVSSIGAVETDSRDKPIVPVVIEKAVVHTP